MARRAKPEGKPKRRWWRRIVLVMLILATLPLAGYLALTRTGLLGSIVLPALGASAGNAEVSADHVSLDDKRQLVIEGLRVRVPGVRGAPGELLKADRVTARVNWRSVLSGSPKVREIEIRGPVLRLSREIGTSQINIASLRLPQGGGGVDELPVIRMLDGVLQLGEHTGGDFTVLRALNFHGQITPEVDRDGYKIDFAGSPGVADGVNLRGRIDDDGIVLSLEDLRLDDLPASAVPSDLRDLFKSLDIRGTIASTDFEYTSTSQLKTTLDLAGVSLNLPFGPETDRPVGDGNEPVRMTDIDGTITITPDAVQARFVGMAADLPHEVDLTYSGWSADAPFDCVITTRGYHLTEQPGLMPLAPEGVRRRLASFSNPTATLDADVTVSRGPPVGGAPGEVHVAGKIDFREGSAAFEGFPYRFYGLTGTAEFTKDRLELRDVTGVAESGAKLTASAVIAPPRPGAAVDIEVSVTDTPIDEHLEAALNERRVRLLRALFDADVHAELVRDGLILTPSAHRTLEAERDRIRAAGAGGDAARLRDIERTLSNVPVFPFKGECDATVHITRELGEDNDWVREVRVLLPSAGLLPKYFPLPVLAENVEIMIGPTEARITNGAFHGLQGGLARVSASVDLRPDAPGATVVHIEADHVPVDERLIRAVPDARPSPDRPGLRTLLTNLGLDGRVSCEADVTAINDEAKFDVRLDVGGVESRPVPLAGADPGQPMRLRVTSGRVRAENENVLLSLDAVLAEDGAATPGAGVAEVTLALTNLGEGRTAEIDGEVRVEGLEASAPVERLVAIFSPDAGDQIISLRERYHPEGRAGVIVRMSGALDDRRTVSVEFTDLDRLELDAFGARVAFDQAGGRVRVNPLDDGRLVLRWFSSVLYANGRRVGALWADGIAPLSGRLRHGDETSPSDRLRITLSDADFEDSIAREFLLTFVPEALASTLNDTSVAGVFDANIDLEPSDDPTRDLEATGVVRPQRLTLERAGERVVFDRATARVEFGRTGGSWRDGWAESQGWTLATEGDWSVVGETVAFDGTFTVDAPSGITPQCAALLPETVRNVLSTLQVEFPGGVHVADTRLAVTFPGRGATARYAVEGYLETGGAQLNPGAEVHDLIGRARFRAGDDGQGEPELDLHVHADEFTLADIEMTNGRARVVNSNSPGVVAVPLITADLHGGRLAGSAVVRTAEGESARFASDFRVSGVPLAELLQSWATDVTPPSEEVSDDATRDKTRGLVDGSLTIAGIAGDPSSVSGRGDLVIGGGSVVDLPLLVSLMEVSNLQVPVGEPLGLAEASFYVRGDEVVFERLAVFANSIEVFGYGSIDWEARALDLRFNSRAIRRIPMLSRIVEVFRDELVTTRVVGPLTEPEVSLAQFQTARRILERVGGSGVTDADRRLLEAQRAALANRDRVRRVGDTVDRAPSGATKDGSPE